MHDELKQMDQYEHIKWKCLVINELNPEEDIDFDETYALVARPETIRLLLVFAYYMNFKLFQTNLKSSSSPEQSFCKTVIRFWNSCYSESCVWVE